MVETIWSDFRNLRRAAVSFFHEHGIFLREEDRRKLGVKIGASVDVILPETEMSGPEVCRDFGEINIQREAESLFALLSAVQFRESLFLDKSRFGKVGSPDDLIKDIAEFCPEFGVKPNSPFNFLCRKIESMVGTSNSHSHPALRNAKEIRKKTKDVCHWLAASLSDFYKKADCVIGAGSYLSYEVDKPLETAYGCADLNMDVAYFLEAVDLVEGLRSRICVNPFILKWIIDDYSVIEKGNIRWNQIDLEIEQIDAPEVLVDRIAVKCYVPSVDILPFFPRGPMIATYLQKRLRKSCPFVTNTDFLFPFTCPSVVEDVKCRSRAGRPIVIDEPSFEEPRIHKLTKVEVRFFDFPRYNRKIPLVLDTSSIDFSRFPVSRKGEFFQSFLQDRDLIIPRVVVYELKTRFETKDESKIERALMSLNKMKTWGFIKSVRFQGEFPSLAGVKDPAVNDLRDCMVLDVAMANNAAIFTNDRGLVKFATVMGIYTVSFSCLEEDVMKVIREHNVRLSREEAVKEIDGFGLAMRGMEYTAEGIAWMIEQLIQQGLLGLTKSGSKDVLYVIERRYADRQTRGQSNT